MGDSGFRKIIDLLLKSMISQKKLIISPRTVYENVKTTAQDIRDSIKKEVQEVSLNYN